LRVSPYFSQQPTGVVVGRGGKVFRKQTYGLPPKNVGRGPLGKGWGYPPRRSPSPLPSPSSSGGGKKWFSAIKEGSKYDIFQ
jgi:hypothetical protein